VKVIFIKSDKNIKKLTMYTFYFTTNTCIYPRMNKVEL